MKEELISFETAKLANEKGFDWECQNAISEIDNEIYHANYGVVNWNERPTKNDALISSPTQSLLQRWLREEHNLEVFAKSEYRNTIKIGFYHGGDLDYSRPIYKTYEEALERGLQEALKLIKL